MIIILLAYKESLLHSYCICDYEAPALFGDWDEGGKLKKK